MDNGKVFIAGTVYHQSNAHIVDFNNIMYNIL